jgi:hypothetical protein
MDVPLPLGLKGIDETPKLKEVLVNLLNSGEYLIRSPGLSAVEEVATLGCRGASTWYVDGNAYFVIGQVLYQLNSALDITTLGTIDGFADCDFSGGQIDLVIIVKGGKGYTYNATAGLVEITSSNFVPSSSVDFIDGRHVYIPTDGSPAFFSEVDQAGTINALNLFDAEELPDLNKVVINTSNNLFIGGEVSFEVQRTTGDAVAPFRRRDGARVDVGYVSGLQRYKSSFMFIGSDRDQAYAIHLMGSGSTTAVSNDTINELLNDHYTKTELELTDSFSYSWKGLQVIGWNLARHTIVNVGGNWAYLCSDIGLSDHHKWRGKGICFAHGRYFAGDKVDGNIGQLVNDPTEYGLSTQYMVQTFARFPKGSYSSIKSLELDCLTGENATTIGLSLSKDARSYSKFQYRNLQSTGNYNRRIRWAGGLGRFESFMGIRIRGTGDIKLSIENLVIE